MIGCQHVGVKACVVVAIFALCGPAHAQWSVVSLHDPSVESSIASGTGAGQQVGSVVVGGLPRARAWAGSAALWVDLNPLGATQSQSLSIDAGHQWGWANFGGATHAGRWSGSAATWVDMHPSNPDVIYSDIKHARGGQQVGNSFTVGTFGTHASVWSGTAASFVDLHPDSMLESWGVATDGATQVGIAFDPGDGTGRASMWTGSATSWVNLNPAGATESWALAADAGLQFGWANFGGATLPSMWSGSSASWTDLTPLGHTGGAVNAARYGVQVGNVDGTAALWQGSAATYVDLGAFVPAGFSSSSASDVWTDGSNLYVVGYGLNDVTGATEALLWTSPVPAPGSAVVLVLSGLVARRRRR